MALGVGGLCQLLAGMWEFACGNTFGATGKPLSARLRLSLVRSRVLPKPLLLMVASGSLLVRSSFPVLVFLLRSRDPLPRSCTTRSGSTYAPTSFTVIGHSNDVNAIL